MAAEIEILTLLAAIVFLYILFRLTKSLISLLINSAIAIVVLLVLNLLGLGLQINVWSVLIIAIGGIFGLLSVLILHLLKIAF